MLYDADSLELISVTVQIIAGNNSVYENGEFGDSLECTTTPSLLTDDRCDQLRRFAHRNGIGGRIYGLDFWLTGEGCGELAHGSGNLIGMQQEWIPSTGTLVVSRAGGLPFLKSTFEMLLRTLAFRNPSQNPLAGNRIITMFATDTAGSGPEVSLTVIFTDVNQVRAWNR